MHCLGAAESRMLEACMKSSQDAQGKAMPEHAERKAYLELCVGRKAVCQLVQDIVHRVHQDVAHEPSNHACTPPIYTHVAVC